MSTKLQVILLILLLIVLICLIRQVKKRKLDLKYTLSWLLLVVALIFLTIFPNILVVLTEFVGIASPINMIFFCGFCFALFIIYTLTIAISKMSEEIKNLTQKLALVEKKEKDMEEKK